MTKLPAVKLSDVARVHLEATCRHCDFAGSYESEEDAINAMRDHYTEAHTAQAAGDEAARRVRAAFANAGWTPPTGVYTSINAIFAQVLKDFALVDLVLLEPDVLGAKTLNKFTNDVWVDFGKRLRDILGTEGGYVVHNRAGDKHVSAKLANEILNLLVDVMAETRRGLSND